MAEKYLTAEEPKAENVLQSKTRLYRLVEKAEVFRLKKSGRKILTPQFVLLFLNNDTNDGYYTIHIRKRFGSAVERNRAKRVFRSSLLQLRESMRGVSLIIVPRRGGKGLCTAEMVLLLEKYFAETGISQQK